MSPIPRVCGLLLGVSALCAPHPCSAQVGGSVVTGVVRDAQGVCQMGVLVQVLAPGLGTVGSAFTDEHGRYSIAHLLPGRYHVRATAAMFLPATRSTLATAADSRTVVNLTLSTLFDTTGWLHAQPRRPDEPADDWTWTLRSTADRPILRMAGQTETAQVAGDADSPGDRSANRIHVRAWTAYSSGGLGEPGLQEAIVLQRQFASANLASLQMAAGADGAVTADVHLETKQPFGNSSQTALQYLARPGLRLSGGQPGVEAVRFGSLQQMALGDRLALQAGGAVEAVRTPGKTLLATHPYLRVIALPDGRWRVQYTLRSEIAPPAAAGGSGEAAGQGGMTRPEATLLPAPDAQGVARLQNGRHQELAVEHGLEDARIEVAIYRDDLRNVLLSGLGSSDAMPAQGLLTDQSTGNFAAMGTGYVGQGARLAWTAPLGSGLWIVTEYSVGRAMHANSAPALEVSDAIRAVQPRASQAALIAIRGSSRRTGTQMRATYRWQPVGDVTAVDPYGSMTNEAYFGLYVRQPLRMSSWLPPGLEATVDVSNLLAQGYRPFLSVDGQILYLAQTPRNVQAGLAFNF